jgi:DNA polymerase lambda
LFDKLIAKLHKEDFLTHDLTFHKDGNQRKYLGVCKLLSDNNKQSKHRRLDIIVVPPTEKATALMYFTGSAHFNRSMRLLASKMGMSLSEHALRTNILRGGKGNKEKLNQGCILHTPTEESVFQHLGLAYRKPSERDH